MMKLMKNEIANDTNKTFLFKKTKKTKNKTLSYE